MEATIFNIQKFSIHDGPGIRTSVFFKGCNLHCKWCANPESQCIAPQLTLDRRKCSACLRCVESCAVHARCCSGDQPTVDAEKCTLCGECMRNCPVQAIGMEGRIVTAEDLLTEVMKDKPFYDHSGGGVTFSGGEPLMQLDFAVEFAKKLHEQGVHVAIETAAAVPNERFCAMLRELDYAFVDLKHYDSARHREGTGLGNGLVLENIRSLARSGIEYTIRIPVIPGYNDAIEDARGFASCLASLGVQRVQMLPFHQLGEQKYSLLGMNYAYNGTAQLHREDLMMYQKTFIENGIEAFF